VGCCRVRAEQGSGLHDAEDQDEEDGERDGGFEERRTGVPPPPSARAHAVPPMTSWSCPRGTRRTEANRSRLWPPGRLCPLIHRLTVGSVVPTRRATSVECRPSARWRARIRSP